MTVRTLRWPDIAVVSPKGIPRLPASVTNPEGGVYSFLGLHGKAIRVRALDDWAYRRGVTLDFIRPGKPTENGFIEAFNGKLRDECLNTHQFLSIEDARSKFEAWRVDYNEHRPHISLGQLSPREYLKRSGTEYEEVAIF